MHDPRMNDDNFRRQLHQINHQEFLKDCIANGEFPDIPLDEEDNKYIEYVFGRNWVKKFGFDETYSIEYLRDKGVNIP